MERCNIGGRANHDQINRSRSLGDNYTTLCEEFACTKREELDQLEVEGFSSKNRRRRNASLFAEIEADRKIRINGYPRD